MLCASCSVLAQSSKTDEKVKEWSLGAGYWFNTYPWRPGLQLSGERIYHRVSHVKSRKRDSLKTVERYHDGLIAGSLSAYWHKGNQTGIALTIAPGYRWRWRSGIFGDLRYGVGYLRLFNAGKTYEVSNEGEINEIKGAGSNYLLFSLAASAGYSWEKNSRRWSVHYCPELLIPVMYNAFLTTYLMHQVGVSISIRQEK